MTMVYIFDWFDYVAFEKEKAAFVCLFLEYGSEKDFIAMLVCYRYVDQDYPFSNVITSCVTC